MATGAIQMLHGVRDALPRHRLLAADFSSLPPSGCHLAHAERALNAPVVARKTERGTEDLASYLDAASYQGRSDIFFATDFAWLVEAGYHPRPLRARASLRTCLLSHAKARPAVRGVTRHAWLKLLSRRAMGSAVTTEGAQRRTHTGADGPGGVACCGKRRSCVLNVLGSARVCRRTEWRSASTQAWRSGRAARSFCASTAHAALQPSRRSRDRFDCCCWQCQRCHVFLRRGCGACAGALW